MTTETAGEFRESKAALISPSNDDESVLMRIHANADLFTTGEKTVLDWNTKKKDVILEIAHDIEFLIKKGHPKYFGKTLQDISSLVNETLREHQFVDENAFSWIRKVLHPYGFTNSQFANVTNRLGTGEGTITSKQFTYLSKEQIHEMFDKMSIEEQVKTFNGVLSLDTERKRQIKLTKDNMKLEFQKRGIDPKTYSIKTNMFDPSYDDSYDDDDDMPNPPAELRQNHLGADVVKEMIDEVARTHKILSGIYEKMLLFPPQTHELDLEIQGFLKITKTQIFEQLNKFLTGFNDDKAVSNFVGWFDYLLHKLVHGNNAAASKYATATGEFQEVTRPDGTKFLQMLKRKVTNEHLKKKMPEQIKEIKNFWLFEALFNGMTTWTDKQYYVVGGSDVENAEIEREYKEAQT